MSVRGNVDRVGLDALGAHPVELLPAYPHLLGQVVDGRLGRLAHAQATGHRSPMIRFRVVDVDRGDHRGRQYRSRNRDHSRTAGHRRPGGRVALVDEPQADQGQPRLVARRCARTRSSTSGARPPVAITVTSSGSPGRARAAIRSHDAVDLAGEAVDDARLQRLDRVACRSPTAAGPAPPCAAARRARGQRVDRDLDARRDRAAEVLPRGRHRVEVRRGPEVHDDARAAVQVRRRPAR